MALKSLSLDEFLSQFDVSVHCAIREKLQQQGVAGVVCFECRDFCSSHFGERTAMIYGPECTYKDLSQIDGQHLGDLPSQRKYAVTYHQKDGV